jgi:hypothetical protein
MLKYNNMSTIPLLFNNNDPKFTRQKYRITARIEKDGLRHALGINMVLNPDGTPRDLSDESFVRATNLSTEDGNKIFPTD